MFQESAVSTKSCCDHQNEVRLHVSAQILLSSQEISLFIGFQNTQSETQALQGSLPRSSKLQEVDTCDQEPHMEEHSPQEAGTENVLIR